MGEALKGGSIHENVLGAVDPSPTAHSKLLYDHEKSVGLIQATREVKITPKYGGKFGRGDLLRIEIPTVDMLDTDNFCISFDLVINNGIESTQLAPDDATPDSNFNYLSRTAHDIGTVPALTTRKTFTNLREGGKNAKPPNETPFPPIISDQLYGIDAPKPEPADQPTLEILEKDINGFKRLFNPIGLGSFLTTSTGVQKMFTRVVLKQGSITIEDKQRYNYLYSTLIKTQTPAGYRKTAGFINEGIREEGNQSQFLTSCVWSSYADGKRYVIRPLLGLFDAGKSLPTALCGQFTLEFYFETPENFLISSMYPYGKENLGAGKTAIKESYTVPPIVFPSFPHPDYHIKNVRAHCPFFVTDEGYTEKLMTKVQSGGLEIHYDTYTTHERTIQNSWSGAGHMNFQDRSVSLKGGFLLMIRNTDINDVGTDLGIFSSLGMEHYQWKIGSEYLPPQDVLCEEPGFGVGSAEAFTMLDKAFDRFGEITTHGEIDYWNFSRRIYQQPEGSKRGPSHPYTAALDDVPECVYKRRRYGGDSHFVIPLQLEKVPGMISGYNALASNTDIEFMYRLDGNGKASRNTGMYYLQPVIRPLWKNDKTAYTPAEILERSLGDPYSEYGDLAPKESPTSFQMYFFAHKDVLFVLKDLGAVEIRM